MVMYKGKLMLYRDPKTDLSPTETRDLEGTQFQFLNGTKQIQIQTDGKEESFMEFGEEDDFTRWKDIIIAELD